MLKWIFGCGKKSNAVIEIAENVWCDSLEIEKFLDSWIFNRGKSSNSKKKNQNKIIINKIHNKWFSFKQIYSHCLLAGEASKQEGLTV